MRVPARIQHLLLPLRQRLARRMHRARFRGERVPLAEAQTRGLPAAVDNRKTVSTGASLGNRFLADALAADELGTWALDADTLDFFEREIRSKRPRAILEFGAGVSTLCFVRYMIEAGDRGDGPCVFSIEQNEWQAEKSRRRLAALGWQDRARVLHAPLATQTVGDVSAPCYGLTPAALADFLGDVRPDLVLVDGPSGDGLVRFGTLPLVRGHVAPGAAFFLDDALRPEEREVARAWAALPYLRDLQVVLLGKGLLTGSFEDQAGPA